MSEISTSQGTISVSLSGNTESATVTPSLLGTFQRAQMADKLTVARAISLSGDAAGSVEFDGSGDVAIPAVVERLTNEELEAMLT